jgi:hypothetical protein
MAVARWTAGYYPFYPLDGGNFDQPELAIEFFENLQLLNPQRCATIKIDAMSLSQHIKELKANESLAFPMMKRLLEYLGEQDEIDVLVAVDGVNALYVAETEYRDAQSVPLTIDQLPVVKSIRTLIDTGLNSVFHQRYFDIRT